MHLESAAFNYRWEKLFFWSLISTVLNDYIWDLFIDIENENRKGNYLLKNVKNTNLYKRYKSILGIITSSFLWEPVIIQHFKRWLLFIVIMDYIMPLQNPCLTFRFLNDITITATFWFKTCGGIPDDVCVLRSSSE